MKRVWVMLMKWFSFGRRRRGVRPPPGGRKVWRITAEHPQGGWVDAETRPSRPRESTSPAPFDSWTTSSMDLRDGVQVVEDGKDESHGPQDPRPH
ncbi:MAG: hypothetical protein QM722_07220 [Piscinibacter sp.]